MRYFIDDRTPPILESFSLDMNIALLSLTFSETIDVSTINLTQFTFQNARSHPSSTHTLIDGLITTPNGPSVNVTIFNEELNNIKAIDGLADSNFDPLLNTFLAITSFAFRDMNMNFNNEIRSDTMAQRITSFILDTTRPELVSSTLNLNEGSLTLNFSETMRESTLDLTLFSLLDNESTFR